LIRDIRRAASDARDWDVFAESVRNTDRLIGPELEPARSYLLGLAAGCRAVAQSKLRSAATDHGRELDEAIAPLDAFIAPFTGPIVGDLATERLRALFSEFDAEITQGPRSAAELHRLRITGKRLRYAIELFAGTFPPLLRDTLYPAIEHAQELLGNINDAHVAADRLEAIRAGVRKIAPTLAEVVYPGLDSLIGGVERDAADGKRDFRRWCRDWALILVEHPLGELLRPASVAAAV
jgi:CHAD domain-containing protein